MSGKSSREPIFLSQNRVLELHDVFEVVLMEQRAGHVDIAVVVVLITPNTDGVVVLQGEAEWVDLFVATSAVGSFAVHCKPFAECEVRFGFGRLFVQGGDIGRWWFRWVVENYSGNPRAAGDGLRAFGAGRHCHHGCVCDESSVAAIFDRNAVEL